MHKKFAFLGQVTGILLVHLLKESHDQIFNSQFSYKLFFILLQHIFSASFT